MYYQKAQAGLIRKGKQDTEFVQELVNCGEAFTDLEHVRKLLSRTSYFGVCFVLSVCFSFDVGLSPFRLYLTRT